jgi:2OG-Fe(II) oxygenase superfamily.
LFRQEDPGVYTVEKFLTAEECEHFVEVGQGHGMGGALVRADKRGVVFKGRRGTNGWIDITLSPNLLAIGERVGRVVQIPLENAEKFQVIHFGVSQQYRAHFDGWLHDALHKAIRNMRGGGQGVITALWYLNKVTAGGGTKFTKVGIETPAQAGKVVVFQEVHPGTNQRHTLLEHAGMPVAAGEKWGFKLWFRELLGRAPAFKLMPFG